MKIKFALLFWMVAYQLPAQVFNRIEKTDNKTCYVYTTSVEVNYIDDSKENLDRTLKDRDLTLSTLREHVAELASSRVVIDTRVTTQEKAPGKQNQFTKAASDYKSTSRATTVADVEIKIISEQKKDNHLISQVEIWVKPVEVPAGFKSYPDSLIGDYSLFRGKKIANGQHYNIIIKKDIVFDDGYIYTYFDKNEKQSFTNNKFGYLTGDFNSDFSRPGVSKSELDFIMIKAGTYRSTLLLNEENSTNVFLIDLGDNTFFLTIWVKASPRIPVKDYLRAIVRPNLPNGVFEVVPFFSLNPRIISNR